MKQIWVKKSTPPISIDTNVCQDDMHVHAKEECGKGWSRPLIYDKERNPMWNRIIFQVAKLIMKPPATRYTQWNSSQIEDLSPVRAVVLVIWQYPLHEGKTLRIEITGWPVTLFPRFCCHQNKGCILEYGPYNKTQVFFWCQQHLGYNVMGHPVQQIAKLSDQATEHTRTILWKTLK